MDLTQEPFEVEKDYQMHYIMDRRAPVRSTIYICSFVTEGSSQHRDICIYISSFVPIGHGLLDVGLVSPLGYK